MPMPPEAEQAGIEAVRFVARAQRIVAAVKETEVPLDRLTARILRTMAEQIELHETEAGR